MTAITAALVKELRDKTNAGMMDCKKALNENNGDMEAAVDWLRTKGLASAAKKSGRAAAEGLVAVASNDNTAAIIELNAETDFVSRNEQFQENVAKIANLALETTGDVEELKKQPLNGSDVQQVITDMVASIGENMNLRRSARVSVDNGVVASYIHGALVPGLGKIGVLVALDGDGASEEVGKQVAMHIAASNPAALSVEDLDADLVERERQVLIDQAKDSGKPAEIIEKMIEGRMSKYYKEVVLLEQAFIMDTDKTVKQVLSDAGANLVSYVRFELGEGVDKKEDNFAEEVAAMTA